MTGDCYLHLSSVFLPFVQLGDKNILFLVIQLQFKSVIVIHIINLNNKHTTSYKSTPKVSSAISKHLYANPRTLEMTTWRRALLFKCRIQSSMKDQCFAVTQPVELLKDWLMSWSRVSGHLNIQWVIDQSFNWPIWI